MRVLPPIRLFLLVIVFLSVCAIPVLAQVTSGEITGTIFDQQGAALPDAEISVTDTSTALTRTTVSTASGGYSLPALPPGTYNLTVKSKGFSTLQQKGISLVVGQVLTLNQTLKPGAVSEVVEVTGEPPLVETSKTEIGGSDTPTEVTSLPILDRNFTELMTLVPGVRPAEAFDPTKTRVGNISVNGGDGRQLDISVDGGDNKDLVVGGLVQNFPSKPFRNSML
jgi:Carboxypeptidase regulatory-like domain